MTHISVIFFSIAKFKIKLQIEPSVQNPLPSLVVNDQLDGESQPADPADTKMDLIEEHQEREFHTPRLGVHQVDEAGGTDGTITDEDPYVRKFDVMLDVGTLYNDILGSNHRVFPIGNVAEKAHTTEAAGQTIPPLATDVDKEQATEVFDTLGIIIESSQVVAANSTPTNPILTTDDADPIADLSALPIDDANTTTVDSIAMPTDLLANAADDVANPIVTVTEVEQRVEVSEISTTEERSDPSLG